MFFIALLILSTIAIAGSAAYFSVYGLANTFSGVFWSVVIMGASLEAGKLIAASYLYRYWTKTNLLLKSYMMAGIVALMVLTSGGIFGYLSSGYQTDVLPLKQIETQLSQLEEEKGRAVVRKKEIDKQIADLPQNFVSARIRLMKQFQEEQAIVTKRINAIDQEELELKKQQIKVEAHVGPITYVAKAFDVSTDNATKWLVLLIIFAFDPMAVALTIAVNNAIRMREDELAPAPATPVVTLVEPRPEPAAIAREREHVEPPRPWPRPPVTVPETKVEETVVVEAPVVEEPAVPVVEEPTFIPVPVLETKIDGEQHHPRPSFYRGQNGRLESLSAGDKVQEILNIYKVLADKKKRGVTLTNDEQLDYAAIRQFLVRKGLDRYVDN